MFIYDQLQNVNKLALVIFLFEWLGKVCVANDSQESGIKFSRSIDDDECFFSNEAIKINLAVKLKKIKNAFYAKNRHMSSTNADFNDKQVKQLFQPYVPTPENIKLNADTAKKMLNMLNNLKEDPKLLKPREERLIHQFRYFLESNFDSIYSSYYDGVWMLGLDNFCEQPICFVKSYFTAALKRINVKNLKDLELILFWIKQHRRTFKQYLTNIKAGVKSGMVQSYEVCKSSVKTFTTMYNKVYRQGENGALVMGFAKLLNSSEYYQGVSRQVFSEYLRKHGESYKISLKSSIVNDFGKPLKELIDYLKKEHWKCCPPSNVTSGLGGLPLDYEYRDGVKQESSPTTKTLPSGENIDVAFGYRKFMRYYTTSNITGTEAMDLGYNLVSKYYDQVLTLGREITKESNEEKMIEKFKKILNSQERYYNRKPFPKNESDDEAHDTCDNDFEAQIFCPNRWSVIQKWFQRNVNIMKEVKPRIKDLFYEDGPRKTTPDCLVKLVAEFDPTNGVPSYLESDAECSEPANYFVPFFKDDMGPRYEDYNTNFHEARPGHHLQIQGFLENFADECGGISSWINDIVDYYPSFSEGWGVYAENPLLMNDTNLLGDDEKLGKYGLLKWQIWRALRLIVDVGFHEKNMTRDEALDLFSKYTWDRSDTTLKELTRYEGTPGQATSYMIGQQTILGLRDRAKVNLEHKFNIKDFHYHILSQGQSPFDFVSNYIDSYIDCVKDANKGKYCVIILNAGRRKKRNNMDPKQEKHEKEVATLFKLFKKKKHA